MKRKIYAVALLLFISVAVLGTAPQAFACGGGDMGEKAEHNEV